ncbi:MAG TPA: hypothetical protein VNA20_03035 [Frankiaceae bacterium]|nr:hypothetical protein [Frankiaceae bacterium]
MARLTLRKETVVELGTAELGAVVGGTFTKLCYSEEIKCLVTEKCPTRDACFTTDGCG